MTTLSARSARYMTRFRCLGGECEDTCCAGWTVPIDEPTHRRLKVLSEHDANAHRLLTEGIRLTPEGPDFARLVFAADGRCAMLEADGLCAIHARLGPDALADVCMTYPRYFNEVDRELELFGTVSCPEVARQCLLRDDAFVEDPLDLAQAPRKLRNRFTTDQPYFQPYRELRAALCELVETPALPLADKLFVLLWFSQQLSRVLFEGCGPVPQAELRAALASLREAPVRQALSTNFRALAVDGSFALSILEQVLDVDRAEGAVAGPPDRVAAWQRYTARRARIPDAASRRLEVCLTRYALNHLYTTPYMLAKSPFVHALGLVVRVAALRYLLTERLADFTGDETELDRVIVEVSYRFGRRLEHAGSFERLGRALEGQQVDSLAHAIGFVIV